MIHVRTKHGEFKIRWLKLETDSDVIRLLFDQAKSEGVGPSDGPTDYAIAHKMKEIAGCDEWEILKFKDHNGERMRKIYPPLGPVY